jgi:hypothetical protein
MNALFTVSIAHTATQKYHRLFINVSLKEILFAFYLKYKIIETEHVGRVNRTPDSCSDDSEFKCQLRDAFLVFVVFLSSSRQTPRNYLEVGKDSFLLHPFQFITQ